MSVRYRDAGVDLDRAERITARITDRLRNNLFGGFVPVPELTSYRSPVLVSSIDGIGTKVRLAARLGRVEGLGQDIVHHCVNDIAVHGAVPLFFLDYLAFHALDESLVERIVGGIAQACAALGIRLAGGETAEMPLVYPPGHFDIAGAIVGAVEQDDIVDGSAIRAGDVLLGLPADGLHTNGYSLVQHLIDEAEYLRPHRLLGETPADALLRPHRCYVREIQVLLASGAVHGLAHITGGGIAGNLSRIIPEHLRAEVELPELPALYRYLAEQGVEAEEMRRVFNLGVGLVAVCDPTILSTTHSVRDLGGQILGSVSTAHSDDRGRVMFREHC